MRKIKLNESSLRKLVKQILRENGPFYSRDHVEAEHQRSGIERGPDLYWTEEAIELAEDRDVDGLTILFDNVIRKNASDVDFQDPVKRHKEITSILITLKNELYNDIEFAPHDVRQLISKQWGRTTSAWLNY